ncbi:MAG: hypothetical protein R3C68_01745 [Myxococcota bacterium]
MRFYQPASVGDVYIEDAVGLWDFTAGQRIWARQYNTESPAEYGPQTRNHGGATLWVLGIKTERANTVVETLNGGTTEIIGGFVSPVADEPLQGQNIPFIVRDES